MSGLVPIVDNFQCDLNPRFVVDDAGGIWRILRVGAHPSPNVTGNEVWFDLICIYWPRRNPEDEVGVGTLGGCIKWRHPELILSQGLLKDWLGGANVQGSATQRNYTPV